jgi:hypothetical protein
MAGRGYRQRQKAYKRARRKAERDQLLELARRRAQQRSLSEPL